MTLNLASIIDIELI